MKEETAALFMAYGTPGTLADVGPYFAHIRGGRAPTPDELRNLENRYGAVGGRTSLVEITERQARGAERVLREKGYGVRAYVGMKHWHPFVREAVEAIAEAGHRRIVAVPLAPFYSTVSTEGYRKAVEEAVSGTGLRFTFIREWHDDPLLFEAWLSILRETLADAPLGPNGHLLFTAHSLPKAQMPPDDPYARQLHGLAERLANTAAISAWSFAFQSVGLVGGAWLGPEVHEVVDGLAAKGVTNLLVVPVGFVAENLETLYDLDLELAAYASARGIGFRRAPAPDDRPAFCAALAHVATAGL